jgi:hypothetical protein
VRRHEKSASGPLDEIKRDIRNVVGRRLIEVSGRFVSKKQRRPDRKRAPDCNPLLLAA